MWFSVVCTRIDNDTLHHSGQNVVDSQDAAEWVHSKILTPVMTCIVVDKSTDHAKPHFNLFFTTDNVNVKKMFLSEHELKKALCDTLTWAALCGLLSTTAN